ncbi:tetratricopeptide repeat protein, partial [bacterium]|nr:tetratricopeptide repeat protein [bacterium]
MKLYLNIFAEADILHQRMFVWQLVDEMKKFLLDDVDNNLQIKVLDRLGVVARHQGKINEAINYLEKCWDIYQNINDKNEFTEAGILHSLGEAYRTNGKYDKAIEFFSKSLMIRQDLTLQDEDNIEKAKDAYWPWANTEEKLKARLLDGKSKVLLAMAKAYLWQYRYDEGLKCAKEALEIAKLLGDDFRIGQSYRMISDVYFKKGQPEEALNYCKKAEKLLLNTVGKDDIAIGWLFRKIGEIYQQMGELDKGEENFRHALDIFKNSKTTTNLGISATLVSLCSLYYSKGIDIDELAKEAEQYNYYEQMSLLKSIQGDVQFDKSKYSETYKLYAQSCLNALHHSRYLLDEIIDHIIIQINKLIKSNKKKEALGLCEYLINFWRDYKVEENKARQSDIGDGEPQQ